MAFRLWLNTQVRLVIHAILSHVLVLSACRDVDVPIIMVLYVSICHMFPYIPVLGLATLLRYLYFWTPTTGTGRTEWECSSIKKSLGKSITEGRCQICF